MAELNSFGSILDSFDAFGITSSSSAVKSPPPSSTSSMSASYSTPAGEGRGGRGGEGRGGEGRGGEGREGKGRGGEGRGGEGMSGGRKKGREEELGVRGQLCGVLVSVLYCLGLVNSPCMLVPSLPVTMEI